MRIPTVAEFEFEIGSKMARNDFPGAIAAAAGCRAAWPNEKAGWLLGSFAELCSGNGAAALALIDACLAPDPDNVQFRLQQAECLMSLGRRQEALAAALAAAASKRADPAALDIAGQFLVNAREYGMALTVYDRAITAAPTDLSMLFKRSTVQRFVGDWVLAARDLDTLLTLSPLDAEALKARVDLGRQSTECNFIGTLQTALAAAAPESTHAAALHFALAKSYEDLGEYALSWNHLISGNRLERSRTDYQPETDRAVIERFITDFAQVEPIRADTTGERPIFIVGLPETGITLIERIIGRHSQVHCAGNLPAFSQAIASALARTGQPRAHDWREFAASLHALDGKCIAHDYLTLSIAQRGRGRPRFSDTQPANLFYCALMLRAFPNARIVHLTRQPLAACYDIYRARLDAGFPFAYDLHELADFYVSYGRLMAHWHHVLPGRILDVAYEDVVTSPEPTTRRLLDYLDLPFEPACLEFHLNPAPMAGIAGSADASRSPYDPSLQHWRHFETQLAPLRARLVDAGIKVE